MEEKIIRISKWRRHRKVNPLTLELNITNKCNLKCRMCWLRSNKPDYSTEMNDRTLIRIVKEAIDIGVKDFRFPGSGEPLTRKNILFKLMRLVKESGRSGLLISNGTLFNEKDVKELIIMGWDVLTISLDGPDAKIHDYLRGVNGAFKRTIKTLSLIKKWKRKLKTEKPWLRMNIVLTNKNYNKLDKLIELANKFGFREVLLQPMTVFSEEGKRIMIKNENIDIHLKNAIKKANSYGIRTNFNLFIRNKIVRMTNEMETIINEEIQKYKDKFLSIPCFEPFYNMIISPNGNLKICAISGETNVNVKNTPLKDAWFSKPMREARRKLRKKKLFDFCSHCCVPIFLENRRIRKKLMRLKHAV